MEAAAAVREDVVDVDGAEEAVDLEEALEEALAVDEDAGLMGDAGENIRLKLLYDDTSTHLRISYLE